MLDNSEIIPTVVTMERLNPSSRPSTECCFGSIRVFSDYYRCPARFIDFESPLSCPPARGFFEFGAGVTCYGHLSSGRVIQRPLDKLYDCSPDVKLIDGRVSLPFDLSEIVDNLRNERYLGGNARSEHGSAASLVKRLYYATRPMVPECLRCLIKRWHTRGWQDISFPNWPVDASVDLLFEKQMISLLAAQGLTEIPFIWFWPEGYPSCTIMTHDVETSLGLDFCATLIDIDASYGVHSSFQFVPESRYEVQGALLEQIRRVGCEVNIHDLNHDGRLFWNHEEFLERARKINRYALEFGACGFRSGAMYRNTDWYEAFEVSYDMSVPNAAHLDPQQGGCCTVMPYFVGKILELPLTTTQDYFLFNLLERYSVEPWRHQVELIQKRNGLISFDVHPDYIIERRARAVYIELLAHLAQLSAERKTWLTCPREANKWWRRRHEMQLVAVNGHWLVEGRGSERARVALAKLVDGQLFIPSQPMSDQNKLFFQTSHFEKF